VIDQKKIWEKLFPKFQKMLDNQNKKSSKVVFSTFHKDKRIENIFLNNHNASNDNENSVKWR